MFSSLGCELKKQRNFPKISIESPQSMFTGVEDIMSQPQGLLQCNKIQACIFQIEINQVSETKNQKNALNAHSLDFLISQKFSLRMLSGKVTEIQCFAYHTRK